MDLITDLILVLQVLILLTGLSLATNAQKINEIIHI